MKHYIGIDLGTTNSAICSYDGENVRVWKNADQNDVTPSAIHIDRRGNRYYGRRAYDSAPRTPDNSAILFKRYMGTSTKIELKAVGVTMTPEECSAEILKVLFGLLPEEIRKEQEIAVVITVPAAFNQMKKDATLAAAKMAGFDNVALMQEPVAAVMSVMRHSKNEGIFLIYDLGGGTFDVSIAENIGGKVNLLSNGGIEMCGGRDWDRMIVQRVVIPWLKDNFSLPGNLFADKQYKTLVSLAHWAAEKAKIELSSRETSTIALSESEARCMDLNGEEIYIDIELSREQLDGFIEEMVSDTIRASREAMQKAGISANDVERIVFVGGPTNYKPLRDKVAHELALPVDIDINPMTAVAEGASIFAESIDWCDIKHRRKKSSAEVRAEHNVTFRYTARTADPRSRIAFFGKVSDGYFVEIVSSDTGWSSGRVPFSDGMFIDIPLSKNGENAFEVVLFDAKGNPVQLKESNIIITKTIATIGAIPASHSIGVEVMDSLGGTSVLDFLVREGDDLPKKGTKTFKAGESIQAGSSASFNIKLWEGSIESPVEDNRFIGVLKIMGTDFESGVVSTGTEIVCEYEMADSGALTLEVSIPSIGASFGNRNFYSRQEGQDDILDVDKISDGGVSIIKRIDTLEQRIEDERLQRAREKAMNAVSVATEECGEEEIQKASNDLLEAKKLVHDARKAHLKVIRQADLDSCVRFFNDTVRKHAKPTEESAFDNQAVAAQRSIDNNRPDFENILNKMKGKNFDILWRQDWFVIEWFYVLVEKEYNFSDQQKFALLKNQGLLCIKEDRIEDLRQVIRGLWSIEMKETSVEEMFEKTNIIKG